MRKRSGGGGGGGGSFSQSMRHILRRRMCSFEELDSATANEIAEHLRSFYPDYHRIKLQSLTKIVEQTLASIRRLPPQTPPPTQTLSFDDDDDEEEEEEGRKKPKRGGSEDSEERLQRLEEVRLREIRRNGRAGPSVESPSSEEEEEEEQQSEDSDEADLTSEDAVYGEKVERRYDLTKSLLRVTYGESAKSKKEKEEEEEAAAAAAAAARRRKKKKKKEKNVEMELPGPDKDGFTLVTRRKKSPPKNKEDKASSSGTLNVEVTKRNRRPRFKDLGGMKEVLKELEMEVLVPFYHPQLPRWLGIRPISGILLHGPPGCGKTRLAHAIANETGVPFYKICATELVTGISGASEENIRELFLKAQTTAPSIIFIDEIDAIASKREGIQREMEKRIVIQLMACMDESHRLLKPTDENAESDTPGYVLVIGATNRPDAVDSALRRPGRFDREICLGVPDENARVEILSVLAKSKVLRLEGSFDFMKIAKSTPGFVAADLNALADKAGNLAMRRMINERNCTDEEHKEKLWKKPWLPEELEKLTITMSDFEEAVKLIQPSSKREGFSAIPNVKWENVGGLDLLRQEFDRYIVRRIKYPEEYEEFGVDLETGFLLYGPPGCGKTLIAKAVANEAGANFIHIKGPELLNKYVGESELAVRTLFTRARTCAPCILFFDEVDALTTKRGKEGGWIVERLLNQLLIELDGSDQRRGVFVIGATNRPEVMDNAVLRPGRFGKLLYVPLPRPDERGLILKALARNKPIDASVDLNAIGRMEACENFSGADLAALVNEAAMAALEERLTATRDSSDGAPHTTIKATHFEVAVTKISPSVNAKQKQFYQTLSESFKAV